MRTLVSILLMLIFATAASPQGHNPDVTAYISFDPSGDHAVNTISPAPYSTVNAYVCLTSLNAGMTTMSFRVKDVVTECPGVMATQMFVNMLPGNLAIGIPFDGEGITVASTECMAQNPLVVGYCSYFYLGGDCCIELLDHHDYPRWVVDCQDPGWVNQYCLYRHGYVNSGECWTEVDICPPVVPVERSSWGGIKALYR
jgi:hypothetical protein